MLADHVTIIIEIKKATLMTANNELRSFNSNDQNMTMSMNHYSIKMETAPNELQIVVPV